MWACNIEESTSPSTSPSLEGPPGYEGFPLACIILSLFGWNQITALNFRTSQFAFWLWGISVHGSWFIWFRLGTNQFTPNPEGSQDLGWPQNHLEKSSNFKPVSKATEIMKIGPKTTQNHETLAVESWNRISAKVDFCNTYITKGLAFQSQTSRLRPQNRRKATWEPAWTNAPFEIKK